MTRGLSRKEHQSLSWAVARAVGGYPIFRTDLHPILPPWKDTLTLEVPWHRYPHDPSPFPSHPGLLAT